MVLLSTVSANHSCIRYISVKMCFYIFSIFSGENISVCKFYVSPHWLQSDLCPKHIVWSHFLKRRNKHCYSRPVKGSWPLRTSVLRFLMGLAVQIVLSLNSLSDSYIFCFLFIYCFVFCCSPSSLGFGPTMHIKHCNFGVLTC